MSRIGFYPFDVNALHKGDSLSPDQCVAVIGLPRNHQQYKLKLLEIKDVLETQWEEQRDEIVTIVCRQDGLHVCTDEEAVVENKKRRLGHVRGLGRAQVRQVGVDRSNLSADFLNLNDREAVIGAAYLLGGQREARVQLSAHRRATPTMLPPKK